jgi:histidine triad (HIT) family protein
MSSNCVFCKILNQEIPATIIVQNDNVFVIKDIHPQAPLHYLIIPKKHVADLTDVKSEDRDCVADILFMAQQLSQTLPKAGQFKLIANNGPAVGQSVLHLHFHFLAGIKSDSFSV